MAHTGDTIYVSGTVSDRVTINKSITVTGAAAPSGEPAVIDGGNLGKAVIVAKAGTVVLDDLSIQHGNSSAGGGIDNEGATVTLSHSVVTANSTGTYSNGGGIDNASGSMSIVSSTVSDNTVGQYSNGGGIANAGGALTVIASTISGNSASDFGSGGGIYSSGGTVRVADSTIANNTSGKFAGDAGISSTGGTVTITESTITGNSVGQLGGVGGVGGDGGTLQIAGSLLAGNERGDCSGRVVDAGYNLSDDSTCVLNGVGSRNGITGLVLGALQSNGGASETVLPGPSSPALDAIPQGVMLNGGPACGNGATDQRGLPRPFASETACTIGATEGVAGQIPAVTSAATVTVLGGKPNRFVVTATGVPTPSLSESGPLPKGITFADMSDGTAVISGEPLTNGTFPVEITAENGLTQGSTQSFTLAASVPSLAAQLSSSHPVTAFGWYRSPVILSFTCLPGLAPLTTDCPQTATFGDEGEGQSLKKTITSTDGGSATVTVDDINVDLTPPHVAVKGITFGKTYRTAPLPRCVARDSLSGVASCRLALRKTAGTSMQTVKVRVVAKDRAGNETRLSGQYVVGR